jgi:hypothetical protein
MAVSPFSIGCTGIDHYTRRSLIATVRMGLISAAVAICLKAEGRDEFAEYDPAARETLNVLSDERSVIYAFDILPKSLAQNKAVIDASTKYPSLESREPIIETLQLLRSKKQDT